MQGRSLIPFFGMICLLIAAGCNNKGLESTEKPNQPAAVVTASEVKGNSVSKAGSMEIDPLADEGADALDRAQAPKKPNQPAVPAKPAKKVEPLPRLDVQDNSSEQGSVRSKAAGVDASDSGKASSSERYRGSDNYDSMGRPVRTMPIQKGIIPTPAPLTPVHNCKMDLFVDGKSVMFFVDLRALWHKLGDGADKRSSFEGVGTIYCQNAANQDVEREFGIKICPKELSPGFNVSGEVGFLQGQMGFNGQSVQSMDGLDISDIFGKYRMTYFAKGAAGSGFGQVHFHKDNRQTYGSLVEVKFNASLNVFTPSLADLFGRGRAYFYDLADADQNPDKYHCSNLRRAGMATYQIDEYEEDDTSVPDTSRSSSSSSSSRSQPPARAPRSQSSAPSSVFKNEGI